jgi:hypothetical protein
VATGAQVYASRRTGGISAPINQNKGRKMPRMNITQWPGTRLEAGHPEKVTLGPTP